MKLRKALFLLSFSALALAACAPQQARIASASQKAAKPTWAFEQSDIPVDPAFRFGKLPNGMRYVIRSNATPKGTGLVRMEIAAGSLDESEAERGYAHFVEHMAFNGSARVPEGEMVRLLERNGLAFGADTNASTNFDRTIYMLDLPNNETPLLDTALMLMRETASALTISPEAVERERGVILSEMRDRNTWQLRALQDQISFVNPGALYTRRMPIGTTDTLNAATAQSIRAFWSREYVPSQTTVVVIGDFDAGAVEAAIIQHFADWQAAPTPAQPQPDAGPVLARDKGRTGIYIDPALSERIGALRNGPLLDEPDSAAQRRENVLRQVGYGIINRRFLRIARQANPPFRGAGFGTGDVFKAGRSTNLVIDTVDGKWRPGLIAAAEEYRRAMRFGFTEAEVAEQIANIRAASQNAVASADTRSHGALLDAVFLLLHEERVPSTPLAAHQRLEAFLPQITPARVLAALKREALPLKAPLIRVQGRKQIDGGPEAGAEGGETAIRAAWDQAMRTHLDRGAGVEQAAWAYTQFGPAGAVVSDTRDPALGIRTLRFANGVRLNLKQTDLDKDRVLVSLAIDGGNYLNTRANPTASEMLPFLTTGGLGKHSQDDLQSILAGRTVRVDLGNEADSFASISPTTRRDLELQLQLMAALVSDPGYRLEGEVRYRLNINNFFAQIRATPGAAIGNALGGLLSDNDPRFTLQPVDTYRKLTFAKLKADIADRLARGAIEIGMVGDLDEDQAIALVARTFGALPAREADFRPYAEQRQRRFTADRRARVVRHTGAADQAQLRMVWPTRDDSDLGETLALELLERIVRIELTETLREKLGKAYSPSASSQPSHSWTGYGTFMVNASVDVAQVAAARAAIAEVIARLRDGPVSADELQRARQPLIEAQDNALKTNGGWLALVDRAQSDAQRIERFQQSRAAILAITPEQLQALARRYLVQGAGVEVLALPEGGPPEGGSAAPK